ncbi:MAG: hypothetical protein LBC75_09780 [Fibromonadaceae bacterium]|jgi:hypothetical protein|nr:hypothetical protein [Fibromonadaceae bacterium]
MKIQLPKIALTAIAVTFALSIASASNIPKSCVEEIITISKGNGFDMQKFITDLPLAVGKAKLQAKAPFGKPKDSDKMDIGMTFGCLKSFPESLDEIQSLLKDVGLETIKNMVANKLGTSVKKENDAGTANVIADQHFSVDKFSKNYASISAGTSNNNSSPTLKKCDAVFNPNKKFCYDGGIYDLCDGMSYNPTTHICSGDIAYRALCNETQYNPLKQKCENNTLFSVCGTTSYNPATHGCKDNAVFVFPKCGTTSYDPTTHGCKDNVVLAKCGEIFYDSKTYVCKKDFVLAKCGTILYDPITHDCKDNVVFARCGETLYDPKVFGCKDNAVFALPKCGDIPYNPATQGCKDNVVLAKCGTTVYYPATQLCKNNTVLTRCGATEFYNPQTQECRYGAVFEK